MIENALLYNGLIFKILRFKIKNIGNQFLQNPENEWQELDQKNNVGILRHTARRKHYF